MENLYNCNDNKEYTVEDVITPDDNEIKDFLFTLGCFKGETITIVSRLSDNLVVSIKDARYSLDKELAECIWVI